MAFRDVNSLLIGVDDFVVVILLTLNGHWIVYSIDNFAISYGDEIVLVQTMQLINRIKS